MIGSVNDSSAINFSSFQPGTLSAEEMFKRLSMGSRTEALKAKEDQSKNIESTSTDAKEAFDKINGNVLNKNRASVSYLQQRTETKEKGQELSLVLYGQHNDEDEEQYYPVTNTSTVPTSFAALAAAVGTSGTKISKAQLVAYLQSVSSNNSGEVVSASNAAEITFLKNLIAKFDTLSGGTDFITSLNGVNEAQDYTTVTLEQVTLPIDIRV